MQNRMTGKIDQILGENLELSKDVKSILAATDLVESLDETNIASEPDY